MEDARVRVANTEAMGRGLMATTQLKKGETVLLERPLVAMQSLANMHDVMVCRNCLRMVGSVELQLDLLLCGDRFAVLQEHISREGGGGEDAQGCFQYSSLYPCKQECGEVYCSIQCLEEHFERCHSSLCVGPISEEDAKGHPLIELRIFAAQRNEIFLLVAEVVATVAATYRRNDGNLDSAWAPYADFVQEPWWCIATHGDEELGQTLQGLCEEFTSLLIDALNPCSGLRPLFTAERVGRIVGTFEQNNVGIRRASPLIATLRDALEDGRFVDGKHARVEELVRKLAADEDDEDDTTSDVECSGGCCQAGTDDSSSLLEVLDRCGGGQDGASDAALFAPLDGTALFSYICCMNHSCTPNTEIVYVGGDAEGQPLRAEALALCDMDEGEEVFQSYIDKDASFDERQAALKDYLPYQEGATRVCSCPKCLEGL